jgi:putative membrane protein
MRIVINLLACIAAIFLLDAILPAQVTYDGIVAVLTAGVILWLINTLVRPVLKLLTLPLTVLTFGLFSLILNTLLVMLADYLLPGISFGGFWPSFLLALLVSLVQVALNKIFQDAR